MQVALIEKKTWLLKWNTINHTSVLECEDEETDDWPEKEFKNTEANTRVTKIYTKQELSIPEEK